MIGSGAVAGCAVGGADAVSVLGDFEGGPMEVGQGGDDAGYDAVTYVRLGLSLGAADAPRD